jgi:PAS domain S-box-containing protein
MTAGMSPGSLRRLIDTSPVPLALASLAMEDCPLVYVNDAFLALTGYSADEVIGRNCRMLQGPGSEQDARTRFRSAIALRRDAAIAISNYRRDGTLFRNFVFLHPIVAFSGETSFILGSQYEISTARPKSELIEHAKILDERLSHSRPMIEKEASLQVASRQSSIAHADRYLRDGDND